MVFGRSSMQHVQYLKSRFGNSKGALYKVTGDLGWLGPDPNVYRNVRQYSLEL